jgi:lysophospholipase L1-like esterase
MVFQAYRFLRDMCDEKLSLIVVNAALRAADSNAMVKILRTVTDTMQPEMVVVNLSNNDETYGFKENLLEMYEVCRQNKIKVILVKEANSPESHNIRLRDNHQVIEEIVSEKRIPCLDMHAYLSSPDIVDSGFLWWDFVHLTSYGQETAGKAIAREIYSIIETRPDSPDAVNRSVLRKALKKTGTR